MAPRDFLSSIPRVLRGALASECQKTTTAGGVGAWRAPPVHFDTIISVVYLLRRLKTPRTRAAAATE